MKEIVGREEIAKVLNFGEYPVIKFDLDKETFMDVLHYGDKVRVDFGNFRDGSRYLAKGYLTYNEESGSIQVQAEPCMLVKDLTYRDYMEAVEYSSSLILDDNQEVVIVMYSEKKRECKIYLGKTTKGRKFCSTIMYID